MMQLRALATTAAALVTALASCGTSSAARPDPGAGQGGSPTASPTGPETPGVLRRLDDRGWVRGVVVDSDGRRVSGALVNVLNPREVPEGGVLPDRTARRTTTGPQGGFRVRQARGPYLVQICAPDPERPTTCLETTRGVPYLWTYAGPAGVTDSWVTQTALFTPTRSDRRLGRVAVLPPSTVSGRVVGAAGQEVRLMRLNDSIAAGATADGEGRFRIRGIAPGPYYLAAGGNGWLPWRSPAFTLAPESEHRVDGRVRRGARIEGRAVSEQGPARFTDILVRRAGHGLYAAATTDQDGRFSVSGMAAGRYRLGILDDGSEFLRTSVVIEVERPSGVHRPTIRLRHGAVLEVPLLTLPADAGRRVNDELRDASGTPIQTNRNGGRGRVTYTGLRPGTYTVVAATRNHFALRTVEVTALRTFTVDPMRLDTPTLTLRGRTAPRAVVEATTGDFCPSDRPHRFGGFHSIERADAAGDYVLTGLVPGTLMLGADGWPHNYGPRCWEGFTFSEDARRDLPLREGSTATGRLVYEDTGTPVIAGLSYELAFPAGSVENPTNEHPARARTRQGTGEFTISSMNPAAVTGRLAFEADLEQLTSLKFIVIRPAQHGRPHWLDTDPLPLTLGEDVDLDLGDIPVRIHP